MLRKYEFLETIGQGSFGKVRRALLPAAPARPHPLACAHACPRWQVKKARCRSTDESRAVKIIDKRLIGDVEDVLRYTRELAILNTLNHKHIIKLHEVVHLEAA